MRKTLTPDELFAFYMKEGHWLFMEPERMIHILTGIKEMIKGRRDYLSAIELITTIPEAEKREMQKIYLMQYAEMVEIFEKK